MNQEEGMKLSILAVMLAAAALAGADTGEFLLDLKVVYTTAALNQLTPTAASNGTTTLVVWSDARSGVSDIYGARLTPTGVVLDPAGIAVSTAAYIQTSPAVASDGTDYLVVWADRRADTSDIYVTRVTADGRVLDPAGIAVSTAADFQGSPAVTFDGTNYLVVWSDLRSGNGDIFGARVTRDGTVIDTSGLTLVVDAAEQAAPAVVYDGANVLLVWEDTRSDLFGDIYCARITSEGAVLDPSGFLVSGATNWQGSPAAALGDTDVLVVWHDARTSSFTDVYGARVTRAGEVLDPAGIGISTVEAYQWFPRVAFDGTNYLVVWQDEHGHGLIYGARVGSDGRVLDPQGFIVGAAEDMASPAVAFDGTHSVVVWNDARTGPADPNVYGARVNGDGIVLDSQSITVSAAATPQERPVAACDGSELLVVWDETGESGRHIRGVRLTTGGTILDTTSIRISPPDGYRACASIAYGTSEFLVAWEDGFASNRDVRGARVSPSGEVLDSAGILISEQTGTQCAPATASDGTDFLVAWQDWRNGSYDIYGARVSRTGTLLDTAGIAVCTNAGDQVTPELAYSGTDYLVLWQAPGTAVRDIYGARVSRQGVVLDPNGFVVSAAPNVQDQPAAAADGDGFLVVWSDWRNADRDIYGARVTGTGTVLDTAGIEICSAPGAQDCPTVEYDGTNFLVVWQDERNGEQDIYGARVTPQGTILDTFAVITQQDDQLDPVLARDSGSKMLLAYSGWTGTVEERPYNSPRIWATLSPVDAIVEGQPAAAPAVRPAATIVRSLLFVHAASNSGVPGWLLDAAGNKVMELQSGANDVCMLAAGIYFVVAGDARRTARSGKVIVVD
jgi:hypothetical protein